MSKPPDFYLDMNDLSVIMFAGFAAFADIIEPEAIHRVLNTLARLADSPNRTPAAAEGIRQLVRFLETSGEEAEASAPQQEPSTPQARGSEPLLFSRFRAYRDGNA
jgi:hypothetical protein